jgi:hypothetical protein
MFGISDNYISFLNKSEIEEMFTIRLVSEMLNAGTTTPNITDIELSPCTNTSTKNPNALPIIDKLYCVKEKDKLKIRGAYLASQNGV